MFWKSNPKCHDLPKFQFGGGVLEVKSQSAKICLNFNFGGVLEIKSQSAMICLNFNLGGGCSGSQIPKCQDLPIPKCHLGGVLEIKSQSAMICLNFNFEGCSESQIPKCQDLPNFQLGGCSGSQIPQLTPANIWLLPISR